MSSVRIKGVISTTTLKRGDERTVERTEQVDRLIAHGYVKVVAVTKEAGADLPVEPAEVTVYAPARSASKQDWRVFLDEMGIEYTDEDTRDELIAKWEPEREQTDG